MGERRRKLESLQRGGEGRRHPPIWNRIDEDKKIKGKAGYNIIYIYKKGCCIQMVKKKYRW